MKELSISADDQNMIWRLVATVLHLGRVTFTSTGDDSCKVTDGGVLADLATLLSTDASALDKAFTHRVVAARGEVYDTPLVR